MLAAKRRVEGDVTTNLVTDLQSASVRALVVLRNVIKNLYGNEKRKGLLYLYSNKMQVYIYGATPFIYKIVNRLFAISTHCLRNRQWTASSWSKCYPVQNAMVRAAAFCLEYQFFSILADRADRRHPSTRRLFHAADTLHFSFSFSTTDYHTIAVTLRHRNNGFRSSSSLVGLYETWRRREWTKLANIT